MTKDECKQVVLDIIADIAPDEDLSNVKPEVRLRDQLQLDSMDFLDIVMELRMLAMELIFYQTGTEEYFIWMQLIILQRCLIRAMKK